MFNSLIKMHQDEIIRTKYNRDTFHIEIKGNIVIDIIPAIERMRGHRFDSIYIEAGIDKDFYCDIIAPHLIRNIDIETPIQVIEINGYDCIFTPADEYYFPKEKNEE